MNIQQKLKSITKRLNKNIQKNNSLSNKIDEIFSNMEIKNKDELTVMLVVMLIKSKEVFLCDKENTNESNRIRVLREYLRLIIKKMSRKGSYRDEMVSKGLSDGQYSFSDVVSIVHDCSTQANLSF